MTTLNLFIHCMAEYKSIQIKKTQNTNDFYNFLFYFFSSVCRHMYAISSVKIILNAC